MRKLSGKCKNCQSPILKSKTYCSNKCKNELQQRQEKERIFQSLSMCRSIPTLVYPSLDQNICECDEFLKALAKRLYSHYMNEESFYVRREDCPMYLGLIADFYSYQPDLNYSISKIPNNIICNFEYYTFNDNDNDNDNDNTDRPLDPLCKLFLELLIDAHLFGEERWQDHKVIKLEGILKERRKRSYDNPYSKKHFTQRMGHLICKAKVPNGCSIKGIAVGYEPSEEISELVPGQEFYLHIYRCPLSEGVYDQTAFKCKEDFEDSELIETNIWANWINEQVAHNPLFVSHLCNLPVYGGYVPLRWIKEVRHDKEFNPVYDWNSQVELAMRSIFSKELQKMNMV